MEKKNKKHQGRDWFFNVRPSAEIRNVRNRSNVQVYHARA